jgi:hypothetical protein
VQQQVKHEAVEPRDDGDVHLHAFLMSVGQLHVGNFTVTEVGPTAAVAWPVACWATEVHAVPPQQ